MYQRSLAIAVCLLLVTLVVARSALSAEDPAKAQAQAALKEGNAALVQGRGAQALAKFIEAQRLFASPRLHYSLGQAHSLIPGHEAQAFDEMSQFLQTAKDAKPDMRAAAEKLRGDLRSKVGIVTVVAEPGDGALLIDGVDVGPASAKPTVVLGLGAHRLALRKDMAESSPETLTLVGGESLQVKLQLPAPRAPAEVVATTAAYANGASSAGPAGVSLAEPAGPPPSAWTWRRKAGAGLLGVAAASLVLGVVEHVRYFGKASDFKNAGCGTNDLSAGSGCTSLNDQFNSARTWLVAGYLGAAVLGGAGSYLLWVAPSQGPSQAGLVSTSSGVTINFQGEL